MARRSTHNLPKVRAGLQKRVVAATGGPGGFHNLVRLTALFAFKDIVLRSPRDTGRFKGSHEISMGTIPDSAPMEVRAPSAAVEEAAQNLALRVGVKQQVIHIANVLAYAWPLEKGHSKQAPTGIYSIARMRAQQFWTRRVRGR